jgi:hypothetical protein
MIIYLYYYRCICYYYKYIYYWYIIFNKYEGWM